MMRRLLLSSAKPHQPHHYHHAHHHHHHDTTTTSTNRHENGRQRRLYGAEDVSPHMAPARSAGQKQASIVSKQSYRVSKKKGIIRRGRSLARTRSESDLIRAMANRKANKKKGGSSSDSDDESSNSSTSEDESQRATSLRSFTKEDEERYAMASWNNAFPGEVCSKIGEEDEQSCTIKSTTSQPELGAEEGTENNPTLTCSGSASTKPSTVSPVSDPSELSVQEEQELKSQSAPSTVSALNDEETKTHLESESGNESTSATTEFVGSEVDVEYLLHENDLLRNSLENVTQDRDYLAQDNWNLRMELENLRNQMRFLMTASASPTMYNARGMYPSGSPPAYAVDVRNMHLSLPDYNAYSQYGTRCTETIEELLNETAR